MDALIKFSPPAFLKDFDGVPGLADDWHCAVDAWFESSVDSVKTTYGNTPATPQFYNPARLNPGPSMEQPIIWNAFPKELLKQYGRARALIEADKLQPLSHYSKTYNRDVHTQTLYRPQNEYCEWHVVRDPNTHQIIRITFSSEPPEYWRALFGDELPIDNKTKIPFRGNPHKVLALYRALVSPEVQMEDLICHTEIPGGRGQPPLAKKGGYNMFNKWNTTHGIMHLCSPPNALQAEIQLGADATVLRADAAGKPVVLAGPLVCCALYGGPDRNSDPTIGGSVNALARTGAMITLADPVGLYMDHIDTAGWVAPDNRGTDDCVSVVRGTAEKGMIARLKIEVPAYRGFTVGDIKIGGVNIEYGGHVAECITVKIVGAATNLGSVKNTPIVCAGRCCIDPHNAVQLNRGVPHHDPTPPGTIRAFASHGAWPIAGPLSNYSREANPSRQIRWPDSRGI